MKTKAIIYISIVLLFLAATIQAAETTSESDVQPRLATNEVENQITLDREANPLYESRLLSPLRKWRDGVAEKSGFNWSIDYSAVFMGVSDSPGEDSAGGGIVTERCKTCHEIAKLTGIASEIEANFGEVEAAASWKFSAKGAGNGEILTIQFKHAIVV